MNNNGWIKIHRKIMDNAIYKNSEVFHLFVHCLIRANHKENKIIFNKTEMTIKRGQFITGRFELAKEVHQNPKSVYNRLQILKNLGILDIKSNNKFSLVSIVKYSSYQDFILTEGQQEGQPEDNQRTTRGQPEDTDKKDKKDNNDKKRTLPEKAPVEKLIVKSEVSKAHQECIKIFVLHFKSNVSGGIEYLFEARDAKALKLLLIKLSKQIALVKKLDREATQEEIQNAFKYYLAKIDDKWLLDNYSLSNLNSKFNETFKNIINGKSSKGTEQAKRTRLEREFQAVNELIQRVTTNN